MASDTAENAEWQASKEIQNDSVPLLDNTSQSVITKNTPRTKRYGCLTILIVLTIVTAGAVAGVIILFLLSGSENRLASSKGPHLCNNIHCTMSLVESIPSNLSYSGSWPQHLSTFDAWNMLMSEAKRTLDIASYYWVLRGFGNASGPTDEQGSVVFENIKKTALRGVKVRIVQSVPTGSDYGNDTATLAELGVAEVQSMNFTALIGAGILHTKLWIADDSHFYVGSANTDWRSLTEVKELGLLATNCPCLAEDISKIFTVYWLMSKPSATIPAKWAANLSTSWNLTNPASLKVNETNAQVYIASSPAQLCPLGRTVDIDALISVINSADKFVYVAVMDYYPALIYSDPQLYWPVIDDALKSVVYNKGIIVRVMGSVWNHTGPDMVKFLRSLQNINGTGQYGGMKGSIEARLFRVPPTQPEVPYTRVNHNKYMVTDNAAYIGTSNWSGDYFVSTGGVSCVVNQSDISYNNASSTIQEQLLAVFIRDWNSDYTIPVV